MHWAAAGPRNHHPGGTQASNALTIKLDQSDKADHYNQAHDLGKHTLRGFDEEVEVVSFCTLGQRPLGL